MTADGVTRALLTVNRQLPGEGLHVCVNDVVIVDVKNEMEGFSTAIHWHGVTQKGTPFSDGVPFLSQCPIHFSNSFRYVFEAKDPGTHFYHSHAGLQKANGVYGPIIVRTTLEERLYDHDPKDFTFIVSDWMHDFAETVRHSP